MSTAFPQAIDGFKGALASSYTAASGSLHVSWTSGAVALTSLAANRFYRITAVAGDGKADTLDEAVIGDFEATGIASITSTTATLTGVTAAAGTTDVDLASGTEVRIRMLAEDYEDHSASINALEVAVAAKAADSAVVHNSGAETIAGSKTFSSTIIASISGNAGTATNGVVTTGSYSDPAWITSLAGSKVSGNIAGNSANVTGTVAIANGGTGQGSAGAAINALLPSQSGQAGGLLTTDGTNPSWETDFNRASSGNYEVQGSSTTRMTLKPGSSDTSFATLLELLDGSGVQQINIRCDGFIGGSQIAVTNNVAAIFQGPTNGSALPGFNMSDAGYLNWTDDAFWFSGHPDLQLGRSAAGELSLTTQTSGGTAVLKSLIRPAAIAAASAPSNAIFLDSSNSNALSYKDGSGTTKVFTLT